MNKININGLKVVQTSEYIEVNGIRTDIPKHIQSGSLSMINDRIYINDYEFDPKNRTFSRLNWIQRFINWL